MQNVLSLSIILKMCCRTISLTQRLQLEHSFKDRLSCSRSILSTWIFKNISLWRFIRLTLQAQPTKRSASSAESRETSLFTYHFKKKTFQTNNFIWVFFPHTILHILTMKTLLKCFNQVNKLWQRKDTILTIIYSIKYYHGGFGKIWIRKFIYFIFYILYHSLFVCNAL